MPRHTYWTTCARTAAILVAITAACALFVGLKEDVFVHAAGLPRGGGGGTAGATDHSGLTNNTLVKSDGSGGVQDSAVTEDGTTASFSDVNLRLDSAAATSGTTTVDSPDTVLRGSFWNGSAAVDEDWTIKNDVTSTAAAGSKLSILNGSTEFAAFDADNGQTTYDYALDGTVDLTVSEEGTDGARFKIGGSGGYAFETSSSAAVLSITSAFGGVTIKSSSSNGQLTLSTNASNDPVQITDAPLKFNTDGLNIQDSNGDNVAAINNTDNEFEMVGQFKGSASADTLWPECSTTIADGGSDGGAAATLTLDPTCTTEVITCNDADGCDITMDDTSSVLDGESVMIVTDGTNTVTVKNTSNVALIQGGAGGADCALDTDGENVSLRRLPTSGDGQWVSNSPCLNNM